MPKFRLTEDQLSELIDTLHGEIDNLRKTQGVVVPNGPDAVEMKRREGVLLEILEVLEDAV